MTKKINKVMVHAELHIEDLVAALDNKSALEWIRMIDISMADYDFTKQAAKILLQGLMEEDLHCPPTERLDFDALLKEVGVKALKSHERRRKQNLGLL